MAAICRRRSNRHRSSFRRRSDRETAPVRIVTAAEAAQALNYGALIDALEDAFRADITVPPRHVHMMPQPDGPDAKLLLMPAWTNSGERLLGCKLASVFPDNAKRGKPSVYANYLLISGE